MILLRTEVRATKLLWRKLGHYPKLCHLAKSQAFRISSKFKIRNPLGRFGVLLLTSRPPASRTSNRGSRRQLSTDQGMPRNNSVDPFASLRHIGFLVYLIGGLISNAGSQMRIVAVQWVIVNREPDVKLQALFLGYIGLTLVLPVLLFALPAGAAADRFSRRWLILAAQLGLTACGIGLAWASWTHAPLLLIYLLLFGTGTFRALGWPASSAIVIGLVPAKSFSNAATWRSNCYQLASTIGPLVAGFLLAWWNPYIVFLLDAMSSLVMAICMLFVRPRPQQRVTEPRSWRGLLQGIHFLRRQPIIMSTMTLDMVAVLFGGVVALLPIFAKEFFSDPDQAAVALGWSAQCLPSGRLQWESS